MGGVSEMDGVESKREECEWERTKSEMAWTRVGFDSRSGNRWYEWVKFFVGMQGGLVPRSSPIASIPISTA